jgi:hypothetical protein
MWLVVIQNKLINRLNTKRSRLNINECIKCYIFKLYSIIENIQDSNKSEKIEIATINPIDPINPINPISSIDPLSLLNEELISLFMAAEKKALGNESTFSSTIRCAAFCELAYSKNYFIPTKTKIKTLTDFALVKYNLNIRPSLASSKLKDRKNHQVKTVSKAIPLRKCF